MWVGMPALLQLHRDDCSPAVIITWARLKSDGRGEDLHGGMSQGWDDACLGPDLLFAGCRNLSPKSWCLGQWFTTWLPVSILSAWHLAPLVTAKTYRKSMRPFVFMVFVGIWYFPAWLKDLWWCRRKLRTWPHEMFMMNSLTVYLLELLLQIDFISSHVSLTKKSNFGFHPNLL